MLNQIKKHFFEYGWLMPALLLVTVPFGRAPINVFLGVYSAWGCIALISTLKRENNPLVPPFEKGERGGILPKKWLYLFLGVVIAYELSILFANEPHIALRRWLHVVSQMLVFIFVLKVATSNHPTQKKVEQLLFWVGAGGVLGLIALYTKLWLLSKSPEFAPNNDLTEDSLPLLVPFMLYFAHHLPLKQFLRWGLSGIVLIAVGFYIFYSDGRAALLGFCLALLVYSSLVLRWQWYKIFLIFGVLLTTVAVVNPARLTRGAFDDNAILEEKINAFTSGRIEIWKNVLHHQPPSLLTGIGVGNLRHLKGVTVYAGGTESNDFHNFILNIWYETGFLGLTALLVFIAWPTSYIFRKWKSLRPEAQQKAGGLLSAGTAILSAGLLTPTHLSPLFTIYLPLILAGLICCNEEKEKQTAFE